MVTETGNSSDEIMLPNPKPVFGNPKLNNMGGMILGTCSKAKGSSLSLITVERLGEKAGELLLRWGPSKAA